MKKRKIKIDTIIETIFMIVLVLTMPVAISALQPEVDFETQELKQNSVIDKMASLLSKVIEFFDVMPSVSAQEMDWGCCRGVIGDACRMTTQAACSEMNGLPWIRGMSCDANGPDNFCQKICCYNDEAGYCEKNVPRWICQQRGREVGEADCRGVSLCKKGCCVFASGRTEYNTEQECKKLEGTWDPSLSEYDCATRGLLFEEGCCVSGGLCTWTTRELCLPPASFYKDTYCSSLTQYCNCQKQASSGCYKDRIDVYWFDSCGNPEEIRYDCNYLTTGKKCVNGQCVEGNCKVKLPDGNEDMLKNGESICVYDQKLTNLMDDPVLTPNKALGKFGLDVVGSRHWRWICVDGKLHVEPCADYRQQVCLDGTITVEGKTFREAICAENAYKDCLQIKRRDECINAKHGQCYWFADDKRAKQLIEGLLFNINDEANIAQGAKKTKFEELAGFEDKEDVIMPKCLPKYAPGYKQEDGVSLCSLGTYVCQVDESQGKILGEWICEKNCECGAYGVDDWPGRESYWLELMARRCSALGDCGLKVNIKEKFSSGETINSDISKILNDSNMIALRYDAKCDDKNGNGKCDEDEIEKKDEVNLLKLYAGGAKDPDGADINDWFEDYESEDMGTTAGQAMVVFINELKNKNIYNIYSLRESGQVLEHESISGSAIGFFALAIVGFVLGVPFAVAMPRVTIDIPIDIPKKSKKLNDISQGTTTTTKSGGAINTVAKMNFWGYVGKIALSIAIGVAAGVVVYAVLRLFGVSPQVAQAIASLVGGGVSYLAVVAWTPAGWGTWWAIGMGVLVVLFLFWLLSKDRRTIVYEFQCLPYQPPTGGHDCEECNKDPSRPCSEYRCLSLGAACNFSCEVNKDGECAQGFCYWANPGDTISPKIEKVEAITNHKVSDFVPGPPGGGANITSQGGGCINPFETVTINLKTNEKAQCKVDYVPTLDYDSMKWHIGPIGNPNRHAIDHILTLQLVQLNQYFTVYVRCKDANGNVNTGTEFQVKFCSSQTDFAPPQILWFSPENKSKISKLKNQVNVTLAVNEPVQGCRWSSTPGIVYGSMVNIMSCEPSFGGARCNATLPFDGSITNYYYFKCNDSYGNFNIDDTEYVLFPAEPLNITDAQPTGTIGGCGEITKVNLILTTRDGCCNGNAECFYRKDGNYIRFEETGYTSHRQQIEIPQGVTSLSYHIVCIDKDQNFAETTISFNVERDLTPPIITRIYKDGSSLVLRTDEEATCSYHFSFGQKALNCNFNANDTMNARKFDFRGRLEHSTAWDTEPWHVKCYDKCNNQGSCVVIVPQELE